MRPTPLRVIMFGGLGDVLITTPVYKAIKAQTPDREIHIYCQDKRQEAIFRHNPYVDRVSNTKWYNNPIPFIKYYTKRAPFFDDFYGQMTPTLLFNKNAKEIIAEMYGVELTDHHVQVFLSPQEEKMGREFMSAYKNPILMHVTSRTSKNQEWEHEWWDELVSRMPDCTFLQLGVPDEKQVEKAVDLRGKLSFRETLAVMKYAKSFVGVNSSFAHATNAFDIPGVVIFGPAQPVIWGHPNNINLYKYHRCSPCLDIIHNSPCPYGKRCMKSITVDEVHEALLQQLNKATAISPI